MPRGSSSYIYINLGTEGAKRHVPSTKFHPEFHVRNCTRPVRMGEGGTVFKVRIGAEITPKCPHLKAIIFSYVYFLGTAARFGVICRDSWEKFLKRRLVSARNWDCERDERGDHTCQVRDLNFGIKLRHRAQYQILARHTWNYPWKVCHSR